MLAAPSPTSNQDLRVIAEQNNSLVKKWSSVIRKCPEIPSHRLPNFARLLDNQHKVMEGAGNPNGFGLITEDVTSTNNLADFTRFALPMIRKSYAKLISDNLVGVQPMSQPASLIFYIRYRYALSKGQTQAGTQIMRQNTGQSFSRYNGWAIDPYYSSQEVRGEDLTINGASTVVSGTLAHRPVLAGSVMVEVFSNAEDANPACDDAVPCLRITFNADGEPDGVAIGDCTDFTTAIAVDLLTPNATVFDHTTGNVTVSLSSGSFPVDAVARVNYEYDLEANPLQPEVTLSIDSDSVAATTRRLKTSWSLEAAQDMKAVYDMDAEDTLLNLMADEVVAEVDREILNDLLVAAAIRSTHNFATAAGASVNFSDRNLALMYKVLEMSNIIHRTTLRGPANWMVTSADLSSKFEQLNDFRASDAFATEGVNLGILNVGQLQSRMKLYKDPLFPNCKILMGFKGPTALDTGYIYAPYVPLLSTPTVMNPDSFVPSKGVMTRYGKKLLEDGGLFYATLNVTNL
jgi:hypothetical protein